MFPIGSGTIPAEMERETGIEPVTSSLGSWRSTAELLPLSHSAVKQYYLMTVCNAEPRLAIEITAWP